MGKVVDYTEVMPRRRPGTCQHGRPRGKEGKGSDSRRPERLLRAPRLSFEILQFLSVARRVARVLGRDRAPLVAPMRRIDRDPVAGPRRRLRQLLHFFQSVDLCVFLSPPKRGSHNYAGSLIRLERFEETKALLLRTLPAARRTLGESHDLTLSMRSMYANVLYANPSATLDDLREAVETLEETEPIVRRILGGANPTLVPIVRALRAARAKLNAREPPNT